LLQSAELVDVNKSHRESSHVFATSDVQMSDRRFGSDCLASNLKTVELHEFGLERLGRFGSFVQSYNYGVSKRQEEAVSRVLRFIRANYELSQWHLADRRLTKN
jgi:hypothetical protein